MQVYLALNQIEIDKLSLTQNKIMKKPQKNLTSHTRIWSWFVSNLLFSIVLIYFLSAHHEVLEDYFMSSTLVNGVIVSILILSMTISLFSVLRDSYQTNKINQYLDLSAEDRERSANQRIQPKPIRFLHDMKYTLDSARLEQFFDEFYYRSSVILKYLPTVCVTLGLLGTFIGLSITMTALAELVTSVNLEDASDSMMGFMVRLPEAIKGMGVAFHTSLYGIGSSLIAGFYMILYLKASQGFERIITEKLAQSDLLIHESQETISERLLIASEKIQESIENQDHKISAGTQSTRKLCECIESLTNVMSKDISSTLNSLVTEAQSLGGHLLEQYTQSNAKYDDISGAINNIVKQQQSGHESITELLRDSINKHVENRRGIEDAIYSLCTQQSDLQKPVIEWMEEILCKYTAESGKSDERNKQLCTLLDGYAEKSMQMVTGNRNILVDALAENKQQFHIINETSVRIDQDLSKVIGLYMEQLSNTEGSLNRIESLLIKNINSLDESMKNLIALQARSYDEQQNDRLSYIKLVAEFKDQMYPRHED